MSAAPWLEYRLRRLALQNGAVLSFKRARMLYNTADNIVALERLDMTGPQLDVLYATAGGASNSPPEIKTIFYDMEPEGFAALRFFHPISRGAGVVLLPRNPGGSDLFILNTAGRPMFSKDFTLREVSRGKIKSERPVWQFHGYRHEH